jgi:hypothetical protein
VGVITHKPFFYFYMAGKETTCGLLIDISFWKASLSFLTACEHFVTSRFKNGAFPI